MRPQCEVCGEHYTTKYRGWYHRYLPRTCSSHCFIEELQDMKQYNAVFENFQHRSTVYRSKMEKEFSLFLKAWEVPFKYEPFIFQLRDGSRYVPDFYLDDKLFVEVKGLWQGEGKKKFVGFTTQYDHPIVIVDEGALRDLRRP